MPLPDATLVTVCSACKRASCWHGRWQCADARLAGKKEMTVGELRRLRLEHEAYWDIDPTTGEARKEP